MRRLDRLAARRAESRPIVDAFFSWCEAEAGRVLDETPTGEAISYALTQRVALQRFLDDGRLPIHNNGSERALRREAVGRKNWLFVGSDAAADLNVAFVSLLASSQLHDLEPWAYLRDLLCLLPSWPARRILELAPLNWKKTLEDKDAQQRLDDNVFRRATLGFARRPSLDQVAPAADAVSDGVRRTLTVRPHRVVASLALLVGCKTQTAPAPAAPPTPPVQAGKPGLCGARARCPAGPATASSISPRRTGARPSRNARLRRS